MSKFTEFEKDKIYYVFAYVINKLEIDNAFLIMQQIDEDLDKIEEIDDKIIFYSQLRDKILED